MRAPMKDTPELRIAIAGLMIVSSVGIVLAVLMIARALIAPADYSVTVPIDRRQSMTIEVYTPKPRIVQMETR